MCIYLIKKKPPQVLERFNDYSVGEIGVSSITVAELGYGVEKSQRSAQNRRALSQFLIPLVIADFDEGAAKEEVLKYDEQGNILSVNLDLKNPSSGDPFEHVPPEELVAGILDKERQILALMEEIQESLRGTNR